MRKQCEFQRPKVKIFFQYFHQSQKRLLNQEQNKKNRIKGKKKKRHSKEKTPEVSKASE